MTEDAAGGHFFKFVPERSADLARGKLFAFRAADRSWLQIADVRNARPEASSAGATPYNRLEDLQVGPDGALYLAETGYLPAGDAFGRILRFDPVTGEMRTHLEGDGKIMAQPDNLAFDPQGRLLVCEDQYDENVAQCGLNQVLRYEGAAATELLAVRQGGEPSGPSWGPGGLLYLTVMARAQSAVLAIRGL
jgi:secreted PhoX family phosphatase